MKIHVYVSNLSEDVWDFVHSLSPKKQAYEIDENAFLSDRDIFSLDPKKRNIIVLPIQLDAEFFDYYQKLLRDHHIEVWVPAHHSGKICTDLKNDHTLWSRLTELSRKHTIELKSYSASQQFYELYAAMLQEGGKVVIPESPQPEHAWVVDFFGSKSGIRQLIQKTEKRFPEDSHWIADGYVSSKASTSMELATNWYLEHGGVVLKTNKAHSGAGVEIVPPGKIQPNYSAVLQYFQHLFKQERYWHEFPCVIEAFLTADKQIGGGNPNAEFLVKEDGTVEYLYCCGLRVTKEGIFKGIEVGRDVLPKSIIKRLKLFGQTLGTEYSRAGYHGYFDIDAIYTTKGELLLTESNVRRTGGTHVYHTARQLLGEKFMETHYVLSNNTYALPDTAQAEFRVLRQQLQPLLFTRQKQEGVVIVADNILKQRKFSYLVIGKNKRAALQIETEMEMLLQRE